MKSKIFTLAILAATMIFATCGNDDEPEPEPDPVATCYNCSVPGINLEYDVCNNGDGTVTISWPDGTTFIRDLNGISFAQYIEETELARWSCNPL